MLESIVLVSSLASALPLAGATAAALSARPDARLDQPASPAPATTSIVAAPAASTPAPVGRVSLVTTVVATTSTVATPNPQSGPAVSVDIARYANPITIAAANVAPPRPASGALDNPTPAGGGGVNPPTQATPQPASGPVAPTTAPSSPAVYVAPAPTGTTAAPANGIRPMTLAATHQVPTSTAFEGVTSSSELSPADSSSSGNPPANSDPFLFLSGGGSGSEQGVDANDDPVPGDYYFLNPIPIGAVVNIKSSILANSYTVKSYTWTGASTYSSYTSAAADSSPAASQSLGTTVLANGPNYTFILGPEVQTYQVELDVTYTNGATGSSTMTFNSTAPSGSLTTTQIGTQTFSAVAIPGKASVSLNPGIMISAAASTNNYTAGSFMFLQIINKTTLSYVDNNNQPYYTQNSNNPANNFNGPLIDNGYSNTLGYPFMIGNETYNSFNIPSASSYPGPSQAAPVMTDTPTYTVRLNYMSLQDTDSFSTYLMYHPSQWGGVWIAIAELDWGWSQMAMQGPNGWPAPFGTAQPKPTTKTPAGPAAFPTWVNTALAFGNQTTNPPQKGTPAP